jgi:hypothetical protein
MRKDEIRSLIKNLLPKYGTESEYHPRVIDAAIEKVLAQWYNNVYFKNSRELERYCKRFGNTTPVPVLADIGVNIYYSNYPTGYTYIPIPDKSSGVRRITQRDQRGLTFVPMDHREVELVRNGSYYHGTKTKIGYIVTPERIEYYNMLAAIAAVGVRMDILIPFSQYGDAELVLTPEVVDNEGTTFVDAVLKVLSVIQPVDQIDDNVAGSGINKE